MVILPYANSQPLQGMHAGRTDNYKNAFITSNSVHKPSHQFSYFSDQSTVVANTSYFPYNHTKSEHRNTTANSGILQHYCDQFR